MHIERLLVENLRHLDDREHDFTAGRGQFQRWILLPASPASANLLRALAVAGLGFRLPWAQRHLACRSTLGQAR